MHKASPQLLRGIMLFLFLASVPLGAHAGEPTDQLRSSVDRVIDVLKNTELKKSDKIQERRSTIRAIVSHRFDFEEMAKRSLALHWKKRTPEERKEFTSLFSDLLERAYVDKIERYKDERGQLSQ